MPTKLLRTSSFQITVLYLCLLSVTLLALVAFVYWSTAKIIDQQMNETISAEIRGLAEQYGDEGLPRLVEAIDGRSGRWGDPQSVYILTDSSFTPVTGNLAAWPEDASGAGGWLEIELQRSDDDSGAYHTVLGRAFELPGGYHLFVGRQAEERSDFKMIVIEALAWALIPALILGLLGGTLVVRYSQRRIEAVRVTGEEIVNGDLSRRVPLSGSGDEFDRLAQTINKMLDQIDTLMTGMRTVTDSLAHDLRSPLTRAMSGIEQALRKDSDTQTYRQVLEQTNAELETIRKTFESLVNIARAEAGISRLGLEPVDLSALVQDLFEVYQPIAEEAGLDFQGDIEGALRIVGHRQLLGQAIANLLDNAIKYTPSGGGIVISLCAAKDGPRLAVCDTGPGIPKSERERVLQRFVRLDASRETPGSGLGLSLVAAVVKLHNGSLDLSENSPGLRVLVTFPARAASDSPAAPAAARSIEG